MSDRSVIVWAHVLAHVLPETADVSMTAENNTCIGPYPAFYKLFYMGVVSLSKMVMQLSYHFKKFLFGKAKIFYFHESRTFL